MSIEQKQKIAEIRKKHFGRIVKNTIFTILLFIIGGIGLSTIGMISVFSFLAIALLPGFVMNIFDIRPGRFASKTIFAFNLTGVSPHIASIVFSGSPNQTAVSILGEPSSWVAIYGFAGFGWVMVFMLPYVAHLYIDLKAKYTIKKLNEFKKSLIDEWGEDITR